MKVGLASQTFGDKTSNAILYCDRGLNMKEFKNSLHTVMFMKAINCGFDMRDSKFDYDRGFKRSISESNASEMFEMMDSINSSSKILRWLMEHVSLIQSDIQDSPVF